jgi:hypothetical protein
MCSSGVLPVLNLAFVPDLNRQRTKKTTRRCRSSKYLARLFEGSTDERVDTFFRTEYGLIYALRTRFERC